MKPVKKNIAWLILTTAILASCHKSNVSPDNTTNTGITVNQLADYYIVFTRNDGSLYTLYFVADNDGLSAYLDGLSSRAIFTNQNINNNVWTFTNGTVVYTFNLKKDVSGTVSLVSYSRNSSTDSYTMDYAQIQKIIDVPSFIPDSKTSFVFTYTKSNDGNAVYLNLNHASNGLVWWYNNTLAISDNMPYYNIGFPHILGWKSNDNSSFGVVAPSWKGNNKVTMLFQTSISNLEVGVHAAIRFL